MNIVVRGVAGPCSYLLNVDYLAVDISSIQPGDGGISLLGRLHCHEAKAARLASVRVIHDGRLLNLGTSVQCQ